LFIVFLNGFKCHASPNRFKENLLGLTPLSESLHCLEFWKLYFIEHQIIYFVSELPQLFSKDTINQNRSIIKLNQSAFAKQFQ